MPKLFKDPTRTETETKITIQVEVQMNLWSRKNHEIHRDLDAWLEDNFSQLLEGLEEAELFYTHISIDSSGIPEPAWTTTISGRDYGVNKDVELVINLLQGED